MSDMMIEIEEMIYSGFEPETIASTLKIPLDWVIAQSDWMDQELELQRQYEAMSRDEYHDYVGYKE
jgi:hypothetical protein